MDFVRFGACRRNLHLRHYPGLLNGSSRGRVISTGREFDRAIRSVGGALEKLKTGAVSGDEAEVEFVYKRVQALQDFFNAIDSLTKAVVKLESLGLTNVKSILSILK